MFHFVVAGAAAALQPLEPSAELGTAIALAEARGLRVYEGYQIAPYAGAKAEAVLKDRIREAEGYVVTNLANGQLLTFVGGSDSGRPYAIWRGRYSGGSEVKAVLIDRTSEFANLSDDERLAFNAERAALKYTFGNQNKAGAISCAGDITPNVIVLPPTTMDPTLAVYIMTPQVDKDVVSLGGHYRIDLDKDLRVQSFRALTEGCHDIDLLHDGRRLKADFVRHRSDPLPNEIHVYASLASDAQIIVDTGQKPFWKVEKGKIQKDDGR